MPNKPHFNLIFTAKALGIKELLPTYLDPHTQSEDLLTGVSFASGGMGYDPQTSKIAVRTIYA